MNKVIKYILNRYGSTVKITKKGNTIITKGFIEPLHTKNKSYYNIKPIPIGKLDNSHYLLITGPDIVLDKCGGEIVEMYDKKYITKSNGTYVLSGQKVYVWAVLTAHTEQLEDSYE